MRTTSVFVVFMALLVSGCAPDYDEPGAREAAGGYDLYGLLGETEAGVAEVLGEPVSVGERYDYSDRGHTAFSAMYDGGFGSRAGREASTEPKRDDDGSESVERGSLQPERRRRSGSVEQRVEARATPADEPGAFSLRAEWLPNSVGVQPRTVAQP